jgi:hypothetical protein
MCPACLASAALVVAGVVSTGGLTALTAKVFRPKNSKTLSSEKLKAKEE